jgi:gliding motility-associated-like protein
MITINTVTAGTIAADQTICSGDIPACLTMPVNATGTGTLSYQWQSKTSLAGTWTNIGGATGLTYCPPALTVTTWYQIVVTSTLNGVPCSVSTNSVKITVNNVTAGVMAANQAICNGSIPAPFTVGTAATGTGTLSYQWQSGTSATGPWTNITGATASTYGPPALTANAWYRRIVMSVLNTDTCWATGNVLAITINNVTSGAVAGDQTICSGTAPLSFTVTTAATGTGALTYQWQQGPCPSGPFVNIAGATSPTYSPPALTLNTGYRRITTSTLNGVGCNASSNTICITINNVSAGTIAADQTICNGDDPVPFTAGTAATGSGTLTYQWQIASAAGGPWNDIPGATGTTYDPPAQTSDKWFRRVVTSTFNSVLCNAISNVLKVTINNVNAGTIGNNQTICSGSAPAPLTAVVAATGGGVLSYQWQNANSATGPFGNITGATSASYAPPALTADKWYQLIVTSTLNGKTCSDTTNIIKITVNSVTASVISASQTICSGSAPAGFIETTAATGTGTLSYQWQSAPSASGPWTNIAGATSANYSAPVLTTSVWYQTIVTSNLNTVNCSATSNIIAVTVNPPPTANPGLDTTICRNLSLNNTWATATNFSSVVWSSNGDGIYNNVNNLHPIYTPGNGDITNGSVVLTMTVNGVPPCGSVSASFTLHISDFTIAYAGPDTTICEGMSYVIDSSGMYNATSVTWSSNGSGTFDNITLLHPTYTPSAADVANGFVILSMHAVNSLLFCGDSTDTMILNIKPYPITNAGPDIYLCLGDSAQLSASGGTSFVWNPSAGLSDPTIGNPWAKPMTTTLYTVIATLNGCSKPDDILVTVYPLPVVNAGPDRGICAGDETELTATGAYSYAWSDGKSTQSIVVSPGATTVYYVTGTDYHGCTNIDGVEVTVNQLPVINVNPYEAYICRDDTAVRLQASGASTYKWFPVAGLTAPVGPIVWASPEQSTIYTVTGTDMNGCKNDKQVSIRVYPKPELLLPDSAYVCDGVDYNLIAGYNDSTSYVWQDGSTNPIYTVTKPGFYWVIATNPACSVMDTVTVKLCTKLWVPNAFTPDGNNVNDIFYAYSSTDLVKFEMFIFSRWGEVIFESKDIYKGWDGNFQGSPCPMGVYTYLIRYKGQANDAENLEGEITGIVNLIR